MPSAGCAMSLSTPACCAGSGDGRAGCWPWAVVSEHPDGGVIARAGGVVVDCSLPRLADEAIAALAARIDLICGP